MMISGRRGHKTFSGFTLIELLVVVAIIVVLVAILVPSLAQARKNAKTTKCLANVRGMEMAHWMYMTENNGLFIQAGLSHGGHVVAAGVGWIDTMAAYYGKALLYRCPEDNSTYWPVDQGGSGNTINGQPRKTSYGINNYLDRDMTQTLLGVPYTKLSQISSPQATVQFIEMAEEGEFAVADHPHVDGWTTVSSSAYAPVNAAEQLQTDQHGGPKASFKSVANWGFLDGHAETLRFYDVFRTRSKNMFDPDLQH